MRYQTRCPLCGHTDGSDYADLARSVLAAHLTSEHDVETTAEALRMADKVKLNAGESSPAPAPSDKSTVVPDVQALRQAVDTMQDARVRAEGIARRVLADLDLDDVTSYLNEDMQWTAPTSLPPALKEALDSLLFAGSLPDDVGLRECPY